MMLSNMDCPRTDFSQSPWKDAVLITPQHLVCRLWNEVMSWKRARQDHTQLFVCAVNDTFQGRLLTGVKQLQMARKEQAAQQSKQGDLAVYLTK